VNRALFVLTLALVTCAGCGGESEHAAEPAARAPGEELPGPDHELPPAPVVAPPPDPQRRDEALAALARVAVVGGRASAGEPGLSRVLELAVPVAGAVSDHSQAGPPPGHPPPALDPDLEAALATNPTLVVALDYLQRAVTGAWTLSLRRQRLELALAQLDRVPCPLMIGDLHEPVFEAEHPELDELNLLNAQLYTWARDRPQVLVLPLQELVQSVNGAQAIRVAGLRWVLRPGELFHPDGLRSEIKGQIARALLVVERLRELYPALEPADLLAHPALLEAPLLTEREEDERRRRSGGGG
jgi:hypothetical protein